MSDDYEDDLFRQFNSLANQPAAVSQPVKTFSGSDVMRFRVEPAAVGIYVIEIMAEERDSSVRMSASTSPFSDLIYPELPRDATVTSRYVARSTVELSWKPSPSAWRHGQPIDYCIVVNRLRHFPTHCSARAFKYGDLPPTAAPDAGFRFSWQRTATNKRNPEAVDGGSTTNRKPRKPEPTETAGDTDRKRKPTETAATGNANDVFYECVTGKTRFTFNDVIGNGATYYYDVFAVNRKSNASAAYTGTRVVARASGKTVRLKEGKLTAVHLKRSIAERSFVYHLQRTSPEVSVQIHPCSGQLNVSIQAERGTLIQSVGNVTHLETIRLRNARPGQYVIRVVKEGRPRSSSFRIFASPDPAQSPYPALPKDLRLKTFEKLNTCNSVTVAWMGTSRRQKYCLYALPVSGVATKTGTTPPQRPSYDRCLGHGDRPKTEKLLCRHFRAANDRKSVMTETIRKLKPRTTYQFTVYAVKSGGISLPYEHLTVKTKDTC